MLLALQMYEGTLCPGGCGQPMQVAWHQEMGELFEGEAYVCAACTAAARAEKPDAPERVFSQATPDPDRPGSLSDLPPLKFGVNTIEPSKGGGP